MLIDPRAIRKSVEASPFFRTILRPRLISLDIITHLFNTNIIREVDLLQLRVATRSWRHTVDAIFDEMVGPRNTRLEFPINGTYALSHAERFLQNFHLSHQTNRKNPFASRAINIIYEENKAVERPGNVDHTQKSFDSLANVLFYYGHHIRHINIINKHRDLSYEQFQQLQFLLPMTPNLTSLHFEVLLDKFTPEENTYAGFPVWPQMIQISVTNMPCPLFNALINSNRHVSQLKIQAESINVHKYTELWSRKLWNVSSLTLKNMSMDELVDILDGPVATWRLEELCLYGHLLDHPDWIVNTINRNWPHCVKKLTLYLQDGLPEMPMLQCDWLEQITLYFRSYHDIEFLHGVARTLRRLKISYQSELGDAGQPQRGWWPPQEAGEPSLPEKMERAEMVAERERRLHFQVMLRRNDPLGTNVWAICRRLETFECVSNEPTIFQSWKHCRDEWRFYWISRFRAHGRQISRWM